MSATPPDIRSAKSRTMSAPPRDTDSTDADAMSSFRIEQRFLELRCHVIISQEIKIPGDKKTFVILTIFPKYMIYNDRDKNTNDNDNIPSNIK